RSRRFELCWRPGKTTTTTPDHTVPWATSHRLNTPIAALLGRNRAGRCAMPRAPRPAPLLHRALWAHIRPRLFPLLDEARGSDHENHAYRIAHSVLDVLVPEVGLQGAGIMPLVSQGEVTGVPEHVRVRPLNPTIRRTHQRVPQPRGKAAGSHR